MPQQTVHMYCKKYKEIHLEIISLVLWTCACVKTVNKFNMKNWIPMLIRQMIATEFILAVFFDELNESIK
jgi:hypothetical protein